MRVAIGSDHAGYALKERLRAWLAEAGHEVSDIGTYSSEPCDYPDVGHALAEAVEAADVECGVLVCGTGVGMAMTANRHPRVRAVVCSEPLSARMARQHNDANVLCLGARVVGEGTAVDVLSAFLSADFEGGRHARRVDKINLP